MNTASTKWLLGIGAVVAALVVVAVILGFVATGTREYPEGTPEGTVQRFVQALENGDGQAAYAYLSASVQKACTYEEFRSRMYAGLVKDARITLDKTSLFDDRAEVTVTISNFRGPRGPVLVPPLDSYESSFQHVFLLVRVGEGWRLSQVTWPVWSCPEPRKPAPVEPPPSS